ncbi:hypothetical protein FH972_018809 [Carpinus fangiana]|uniref:TF-B3 domain-containing protein n=1 Tax=Carpinus fangiana TaxID=176857 RepID=A0A5N6RRI7_9ROSI|nr:hypothetical protein FH972_018809 [Carpinus fangiana]
MAETSGDVKSFSKRLSRSEIEEGRVYIDESNATTLFGYPSYARGAVVVYLMSHSNSKKILLCKDGDKYYFNQGWSQFARVNRLSAGDTITLTKIEPRSPDQKKEFMFGVTKKLVN